MKPLSVTVASITVLAAAFALPAYAETSLSEGGDVDVDTTVTVKKDATVGEIAEKDPGSLEGQKIVTYNGDTVGKIKKVVQDPRDDQIYATVDADDFFDQDVNDLMIPVDELSLLSEDKLMMSQGLEDRLEGMVIDEDDVKTLAD